MSLARTVLPTAIAAALSLLSGSARAAGNPATGPGLTLEQAISRAIERSPIVLQSQIALKRAQGFAQGVAGVLVENPLLSAEAGVRRDQGWVGNQPSLSARIEQPLDVFGQAGTRRRAASDGVASAAARLALVRGEVAARVRVLYLAAQLVRVRIDLCQERLATARQTSQALEMRVRVGASSDIDLHMAVAETARAEAALRQAQAMATRSRLELREVLDLAVDAAAEPSQALTAAPVLPPPAADPRSLLAHHVAVQAVEKQGLAVDSEIARLERERLPRLAIGLAAELPSNQERFVGLGLSISPALWRRNQGPLAEARAEREGLEIARVTTLASLERRWTALREEQAVRLQELSFVEQSLADEEKTRALVRTGWQAGKFDFLRVLLAERSVAETKQSRLNLWGELWVNAIELRRLAGQEP